MTISFFYDHTFIVWLYLSFVIILLYYYNFILYYILYYIKNYKQKIKNKNKKILFKYFYRKSRGGGVLVVKYILLNLFKYTEKFINSPLISLACKQKKVLLV